MPITYLDDEIESLVHVRKRLPTNWRNRLHPRPKTGHDERRLDVAGVGRSKFRIILRRNHINPLDFPVILAVRVPNSNQLFRLRRYNGNSHEHTNKIENEKFHDSHIHLATKRYQERGYREDAYAEVTDRYSDFRGALNCLIRDANFAKPDDLTVQQRLPFEKESRNV